MICEYGCGKEAKYQFKNGKWCCSSHYLKCPNYRNKFTGKSNPFYGKSHSNETKIIISQKNQQTHKGIDPWNKGKKGHLSDYTLNKMSESHKGRIPWNKGIKMSKEFCEKRSIGMKGKKNPSWKGGYSSNNIPLYDTYAKQLTIEEKPERNIYDKNILTVVCTNSDCGKRFIPTLQAVIERVRCLNGTQKGEMRLYCCTECKISCSIYWTQPSSFLTNRIINYTDYEYQTFREHILKRDKYTCQYCGEKADHVHHERPQKLEPFFSLDPDLAWSVCSKCHYKYGHKDECSTGILSNKICR